MMQFFLRCEEYCGCPVLFELIEMAREFLTKRNVPVVRYSTPPASKSPAPNMDLGAQDQQENPKSESLQWDSGVYILPKN